MTVADVKARRPPPRLSVVRPRMASQRASVADSASWVSCTPNKPASTPTGRPTPHTRARRRRSWRRTGPIVAANKSGTTTNPASWTMTSARLRNQGAFSCTVGGFAIRATMWPTNHAAADSNAELSATRTAEAASWASDPPTDPPTDGMASQSSRMAHGNGSPTRGALIRNARPS